MKAVTVAVFSLPSEVAVIQGRLESEGVECFLKDEMTVHVNNLYSNAIGGIKLQVKESDVDKAMQILKEAGYLSPDQTGNISNEEQEAIRQQVEALMKASDNEHYLFDFSNEDLHEVLKKPDEWNYFDYVLAQRILQQRGEKVDEEKLDEYARTRIEKLAKPADKQTFWVACGYLFLLLGGVIGVFFGWHLWKHKKRLPNNQQVYAYQESDRRHGKILLFASLIMFAFWLFVVPRLI